MILGNDQVIIMDGGMYLRQACFGKVMDKLANKNFTAKQLEEINDAFDEVVADMQTELYKKTHNNIKSVVG